VISFRHKGDFSKVDRYLGNLKKAIKIRDLERYGREGVSALGSATPVDTGETANSWSYEIKRDANSVTISFHNSHIEKGAPIAIMLQYGHGTRNGGWVQGRDYINPAIQPIFDRITDAAWKEVINI